MGVLDRFTRRRDADHTAPVDAADPAVHHNGHNNGHGVGGGNGVSHGHSASHGHSSEKAARQGHHHGHDGHFNKRPSFGQWLKATWLDLATMVAFGIIGLGVYQADPAPSRSFPITFQDGEIVYPEISYPLRHEIIPIWAAAMLAVLVPIFFFLVMQIRMRSFWDVNNATIGLLYSTIIAAVFQVFLKWLIGGLRPHFLAVCKPVIPQGTVGNGYKQIMFDRSICTGKRSEINDALESFPSGHSTAAFAGFIFLYLYLNAKLKVWSNYHPAMWKLVIVYAPVLAAVLIAGALTIDKYHNWYDCFAGAVIGTVFAFSSYRMVYASVWDFRVNHIPLNRHIPFSYGAGAGGFETAVFTHKAEWGLEAGSIGGAPFDLSHQGGGFASGAGAAMGAGMGAARTSGTATGSHHHGGPLGSNGYNAQDGNTGHIGHNGHNNHLGHNGHNANASAAGVNRRPVGDQMV